MPITIDHSPPGLAMNLAKQAGRAKGRASAAQTATENKRLDIARQGQMLQAQTAQNQLAAEDRRFEISSALDLMNQKSLHQQRMMSEETARRQLELDTEEQSTAQARALELQDRKNQGAFDRELLKLGDSKNKAIAKANTATSERIHDEAHQFAQQMGISDARMEDAYQNSNKIEDQPIYQKTNNQLKAVEDAIKSTTARIKENFESTDGADMELDKELKAQLAEYRLMEATHRKDKLDILKRFQAGDRPYIPKSYHQHYAERSAHLAELYGVSGGEEGTDPETTEGQVNKLNGVGGDKGNMDFTTGYQSPGTQATDPSADVEDFDEPPVAENVSAEIVDDVGVAKLQEAAGQGVLDAWVVKWLEDNGKFVDDYSYDDENLDRIQDLVESVIFEIQDIIEQGTAPTGSARTYPNSLQPVAI